VASSFWKGSISFGLLNIPVSLQSAEQGEELHFSLLDKKSMARIKYKKVNADTGQEVPYHQIVKGYEYEKNQFVIVTDEDFKAANPKATQTIDIEDFVDIKEIDPLLFERPYYIVPQKQGEKGYFLLRDAMAKNGRVAVAKVVLRTKQHLAAILAKGDYLVLELLRFSHEVLEEGEVDYLKGAKTRVKYSDRELKMADALMRDMTVAWKPERYRDTYYQDLMKRIQQKVKSGEGETVETGTTASVRPTSGVIDLLPLLKKSLEAKKGGTTTKTRPKRTAKRAG
jgi:DNA end-binding protein Ku